MRDAFDEILRFWFGRGVAGFRIDVPYLVVKDRDLRDNPPLEEGDPWWLQGYGQRLAGTTCARSSTRSCAAGAPDAARDVFGRDPQRAPMPWELVAEQREARIAARPHPRADRTAPPVGRPARRRLLGALGSGRGLGLAARRSTTVAANLTDEEQTVEGLRLAPWRPPSSVREDEGRSGGAGPESAGSHCSREYATATSAARAAFSTISFLFTPTVAPSLASWR